MLHKLPDNVSLELGALVEPMSVAYHAATLGDAHPGDTAMVFGAGPIGIGLWFALRGKGIEDTFVVEPSATRRAAIETLGARTLDPAAIDVPSFIADHTGGRGAGAVYDAAGYEDYLYEAFPEPRLPPPDDAWAADLARAATPTT